MVVLRKVLSSRKAVTLLVTVVVLGANELFGRRLSAEFVTALVALVAIYLGAQGIADAGARGGSQGAKPNGITTPTPPAGGDVDFESGR